MKKRQRGNGFTLIELLGVIAIIALLAGILLGVLSKARQRALRLKTATEARDLVKACQEYISTYGQLPFAPGDTVMTADKVQVLQGDVNNPSKIKFYQFPVGADVDGFKDPWGNLYHVRVGAPQAISNRWDYATRVYFQHRRGYQYEGDVEL